MNYDTAGRPIREISMCDCGLTGGCKKCNPMLFEGFVLPERLTNPKRGKEELDKQLKEEAKNAPSIEEIHKITDKLPSFSKMLSDERDDGWGERKKKEVKEWVRKFNKDFRIRQAKLTKLLEE